MQQIAMFKSEDGKIFSTEAECATYEKGLTWREQVTAFQNSEHNPYKGKPQNGIAPVLIPAWEAFKAS